MGEAGRHVRRNARRRVERELSKRHVYIYPTEGGREPDREGRTSFTMRWYLGPVPGPCGEEGKWHKEELFDYMYSHEYSEWRKPAVRLKSEAAFEELLRDAAAVEMEEVLR